MRVRHLFLLLGCLLFAASSSAVEADALRVTQTIALPGVLRRIDHLAVDATSKRLFVAALGNGSLEVVDLASGTRATSVSGLKEPQGVAFAPATHRIVVAMRGGGITTLDDKSYATVARVPELPDADNLRYEASTSKVYVGYGEGALAVFDPRGASLGAKIELGAHPESFQLEERGPRIFVNVPDKHQVMVVDRTSGAVIEHVAVNRYDDNYPMSLDEAGQRLFVGVRRPAAVLVFDTKSLKQIAAVPCVGDVDDLFFDAHRNRIYVIGGEGYLDVLDAAPNAKYRRIQRIATRAGARTGLWSSELDRLFVALPNHGGQAAEIRAFTPPPG